MAKDSKQEIPASLGYKMPAEWENHRATWIVWSQNRDDFPGKFVPIQWVYGEITRKLSESEQVCILVNSEVQEAQAQRVLRKVGVDLEKVEFYRIPTNRGWTRDSGAIFVRRESPEAEIAAINFKFNAWAKYDNWDLDCLVPKQMAASQKVKLFSAQFGGKEVVLEGGSIDVNGTGTLLTTEECLLDYETQTRNPHLSREDTEQVLHDYLGVTNVLWLHRGIVGDDTHGHVDDFCRFVNEDTIVLAEEKNSSDANYKILEENRERLEGYRLEKGQKINLVRLPMPAPLVFDGQRLPASYANFYIANNTVLVPTFNDENDRHALGILAELFPDRKVCGIHAVDLVWGLGTLHCLTQQEPSA